MLTKADKKNAIRQEIIDSDGIYMIKILFICHGNICRSPIGEYVFRQMVKDKHLEDQISVASAATSTEELGNPIYPPAQAVLREHGIDPYGHQARQITKKDYDEYDYLILMDNWNIRNALRFWKEDSEQKMHLVLEYSDEYSGEVDDPWYTRDFDTAYKQIKSGCAGLLKHIIENDL